MFNSLKKKHVTTETMSTVVAEQIIENEDVREEPKIDSVFPPVEEMIKNSSENWPLLTNDEILEKIFRKAKNGERRAPYFRAVISDASVAELTKLGYTVEVSEYDKAPFFEISW